MSTIAQLIAAVLWLGAWIFVAAMLAKPELRELIPAGFGRYIGSAVVFVMLPPLFLQQMLDALLAGSRPKVHAYTLLAWGFYACTVLMLGLAASTIVTDALVSRTPLYALAGQQPLIWGVFAVAFFILGRTHRTAARWSQVFAQPDGSHGDDSRVASPPPQAEEAVDPRAAEAARQERARADAVIEAGRAAESRLYAGRAPDAPWTEAELPLLEKELEPMAAAADVLLERALEEAPEEAPVHLVNSLVLRAGYTIHSLCVHLPPDQIKPQLDQLATSLEEAASERALSLGIPPPRIDQDALVVRSFMVDAVGGRDHSP